MLVRIQIGLVEMMKESVQLISAVTGEDFEVEQGGSSSTPTRYRAEKDTSARGHLRRLACNSPQIRETLQRDMKVYARAIQVCWQCHFSAPQSQGLVCTTLQYF